MDLSRGDGWYQELTITFQDGTTKTFYLHFTRSGRYVPDPRPPAAWTKLSFNKCPTCPLTDDRQTCPAAYSLDSTLMKLHGKVSSEVVKASAVDHLERRSEVSWPLQQVGSIFVQLALFSSGCPVGDQMRPLLNGLPPFASTNELMRHAVTKLLIRHKGDAENSKKEIRAALEPLHEILKHLIKRLHEQFMAEGGGDAIPNSLARMDALTHLIDLHLEKVAEELSAELGLKA